MTIPNIEDVIIRIMSLNRHLTEQSLTTLLSASGWDKEDIKEGVRVFRNSKTNVNSPINSSNNFSNNSSAKEISSKSQSNATGVPISQNTISTEDNLENKISINAINNSLVESSQSSDLISKDSSNSIILNSTVQDNIPPLSNQTTKSDLHSAVVENKNSHSVVIIVLILILLVFVALGVYLYLDNAQSLSSVSDDVNRNSSSNVIDSDNAVNVNRIEFERLSKRKGGFPPKNISTSSSNIQNNIQTYIKTPVKTINTISDQISIKTSESQSLSMRILNLQKAIDDLRSELQRLSSMKGGSTK